MPSNVRPVTIARMTFILTQSKRLTLIFLALSTSLVFIFLLMTVFQVKAAAEVEPMLLPTPSPTMFNQSDPYVCLIPDDGVFLPCHANLLADAIPIERSPVSSVSNVPCTGGMAAGYLCNQVDLVSWLPLSNFGGFPASDLWGWTDPSNGKEIVILTLQNGVAFVDISDPVNPVVIGTLATPNTAFDSPWRDVKTYGTTAYIVGDIAGAFGVQVFDLTRLRGVTETTVFTADNRYTGINSAHNIVINEETGLAALVGISSGEERCSGGMHLLDLSHDQLNPTFAGCVDGDGYVHDAQCVLYHGEDMAYSGREICFNFNANAITIVDITDRANPVQLSRSTYAQTGYTHQGWLTADHQILLSDDEGDERNFDINTTTHIWDLSSLTEPKQIGTYTATTQAIDHNQYMHLGYSFQANYRAGMRVLETTGAYNGQLEEVAYFDIYPADDNANFNGAWSLYPYFESGIVPISGIEQGLFLVRPTALENYRAVIQAPSSTLITSGTVANYDAALHTIGLTDRYTLTLLSTGDAGWSISSPHDIVFNGVPTQTEYIPISVTAPLSITGELTVSLILESHQRPGYVITATTHFQIENGPLFEVLDKLDVENPSKFEGNELVKSLFIKNKSGLPQRYFIQASGNSWITEPSESQTPWVDGDEIHEFSVRMAVEAGIQNSYTVTVTPEVNLAASQFLTGLATAEVGAVLTHTSIQSADTVTHTVWITNIGDFNDQFDIQLENGVWVAAASVTRTEVIEPQSAAEFQIVVLVGDGSESTNQIKVLSVRAGTQVAAADLPSRSYWQYLPIMLRTLP
ncbi:MAG: choice-of-anchor B domain-containing protein [Cellvibrionaceae bacterium]